MKVSITTRLACRAEDAWQAVKTSLLLRYVAYPLLAFSAIDPEIWPEHWEPGTYHCGLRFLGLIPMGTQTIDLSFPEPDAGSDSPAYCVRDNGYGTLAKRWDHTITVTETPDGRALYSDEVTIEGGVLTPFIWAFAQVFYRHRQARWRRLVRNDFDYNR